jgi:hypothetical protein
MYRTDKNKVSSSVTYQTDEHKVRLSVFKNQRTGPDEFKETDE